jgi:hypothetical protein
MADAEDSKSSVGNHVRVQVPPSAPIFLIDRAGFPELALASDSRQPFADACGKICIVGGGFCFFSDVAARSKVCQR